MILNLRFFNHRALSSPPLGDRPSRFATQFWQSTNMTNPTSSNDLFGTPLNDQTTPGVAAAASLPTDDSKTPDPSFVPVKPQSLQEAGLVDNEIYPLILKNLFTRGEQTGASIAELHRLSFAIIEPLLTSLRRRGLITQCGSAVGGDYRYQLTPEGHDQALRQIQRCSYCGAAPVSLQEYEKSVIQQSVKNLSPTMDDVQRAMDDLVIHRMLISQLGQAISSGKSVLLFGEPGNGKTSIAQRAIRAVSETIWIPRTLTVYGEVMRLFDSSVHEEVPMPNSDSILNENDIDDRWVRIKRPSIVVGGELTLAHLEATPNPVTGIIEAPLHFKSNCGCLVIDDFGRQRVSPTELLNRWIMPLESGLENLSLPSGRQVQVPFEQLLIFSTNLPPASLCDEAFLRRINYKIEVFDPSEQQFVKLFRSHAEKLGFEIEEGVEDYLLDKYYRAKKRSQRFCQAPDLVSHAHDFCQFHNKPLVLTPQVIDIAAYNYFGAV